MWRAARKISMYSCLCCRDVLRDNKPKSSRYTKQYTISSYYYRRNNLNEYADATLTLIVLHEINCDKDDQNRAIRTAQDSTKMLSLNFICYT